MKDKFVKIVQRKTNDLKKRLQGIGYLNLSIHERINVKAYKYNYYPSTWSEDYNFLAYWNIVTFGFPFSEAKDGITERMRKDANETAFYYAKKRVENNTWFAQK